MSRPTQPSRLTHLRSKQAIADFGNQRFLEGVQNGQELGFNKGLKQAAEGLDHRRVLLQLTQSVGQALDAQTRLVQALANIYDNSGAVR